MNKLFRKSIYLILIGVLVIFSGCSTNAEASLISNENVESTNLKVDKENDNEESNSDIEVVEADEAEYYDGMLDESSMFTDRDLEQVADLEESIVYEIEDDMEYLIDKDGVYVVKGEAGNVVFKIDADDESKIQIVLDGVSVTNENSPFIYVLAADKVFVTTTDSENYLSVTDSFIPDGEVNLDAVIYSKSDLVLNGIGKLEIVSYLGNGVASKDDLKITGGTYTIGAELDALEANDSIRVYDGVFTILTNKDGLHSENNEDSEKGYIYILNGTFDIKAAQDAIDANSVVQIDGGSINVETSLEGIEGTYVQINGGFIDIYASDDGINATKTSDYDVMIEVNGGNIKVEVGEGDTDAFDSNGSIYIYGGEISITTPRSSFDADGEAKLIDGNVTVNNEVITEIVVTQMGRGGMAPGTDRR